MSICLANSRGCYVVSRAQVAIQSSLGGGQQSLKNDIHQALASLSDRIDHTLSMFSGFQEVLSAQSREYKALREVRYLLRTSDPPA